MSNVVIGVIGAYNHSIHHGVNKLEGRDCVIGKKAGIWVEEGDCFYSRWHKLVRILVVQYSAHQNVSICRILAASTAQSRYNPHHNVPIFV